jgi:hypothetical protein
MWNENIASSSLENSFHRKILRDHLEISYPHMVGICQAYFTKTIEMVG